MPGSFKYRLLRYETAPPPGAWKGISRQLDQQFVASDSVISEKAENTSIPPPDNAWVGIESILDNERKPTVRPAIVPVLYRRLAAAAILAAMLAVSVPYFTGKYTNSRTRISDLIKNNSNIRPEAIQIPTPSPAREIASGPLASSAGTIKRSSHPYARQAIFVSNPGSGMADYINETCFTDLQLQPVNAEQPVNVPSRSIRDTCGNIIMDVKLISKPDDPYITITGPNGSQTKISNKFLGLLSSLNDDDISPDDVDYDMIMWKVRFQSWRDKLLNEDSFIPAASNFFDIFAMKDMIQE